MPIIGADTGAAEDRPSLADTLSSAFDETVGKTDTPAAPATPVHTEAAPTPASAGSGERTRNPDGTFAKKEDAAPAAPPSIQRPSSWKKDYWGHWDKLSGGQPLTPDEARAIAQYAAQREDEFAKGVSTYKAEYDRAKPILDALTPHRDLLEATKLQPADFIGRLAATHRTLATGDAQAKLRAFARFAQDYQIPVHELFVQGEDGKLYFNQTYLQKDEPKQGVSPEDVQKMVGQQIAQFQLQQIITQFREAKDASGNPLHPHVSNPEVWKAMDGLLRSGLATDLTTAYQAALALPQHKELREADLHKQQEAEQAARAKAAAETAKRAKAQAVSPKTQAPTGLVEAKERKGLRATLSEAFDAHASGGRV